MTDQTASSPAAQRTRRQLIAGGTGALAAVLAAEAIARPVPAHAADGNPVLLGEDNHEIGSTAIISDNAHDALRVSTGPPFVTFAGEPANGITGLASSGDGVYGNSESGNGVHGMGNVGVFGEGNPGVYGLSGSTAGAATVTSNGVHGITDSAAGSGVLGENVAGGPGVTGSSSDGDGVCGTSDAGRGVTGVTAAGTGVFGQRGGTGPASTPANQHGVHGVTDSILGCAVLGEHVGVGTGVSGSSRFAGTGVAGTSAGGRGGSFSSDTSVGATGSSGTGKGLWGISGNAGTAFFTAANGVHGLTVSKPDSAVLGEHGGGGPGVTGVTSGAAAAVHGKNSGSGAGLLGESRSGTGVSAAGKTALNVAGPAVFSRSGKLTIKAGGTSGTKTGVTLTAASLVLATPQNDVSGAAIRSAVPDVKTGSFTVHLAKPVAQSVTIAWFIVN
jgi:hypothetical protein